MEKFSSYANRSPFPPFLLPAEYAIQRTLTLFDGELCRSPKRLANKICPVQAPKPHSWERLGFCNPRGQHNKANLWPCFHRCISLFYFTAAGSSSSSIARYICLLLGPIKERNCPLGYIESSKRKPHATWRPNVQVRRSQGTSLLPQLNPRQGRFPTWGALKGSLGTSGVKARPVPGVLMAHNAPGPLRGILGN